MLVYALQVSADGRAKKESTAKEVLRDLFALKLDSVSDTLDNIGGPREGGEGGEQVGEPAEEDLGAWGHHFPPLSALDDEAMVAAAQGDVSFVFSCHVAGQDEATLARLARPKKPPPPKDTDEYKPDEDEDEDE